MNALFSAEGRANRKLGWYCYNDEDRHDSRGAGTGPSDRGHCKGTLAFDLESNTAFWLVHSVPSCPLSASFDYPTTGLKMAQTMVCIQLADATWGNSQDDPDGVKDFYNDLVGPTPDEDIEVERGWK